MILYEALGLPGGDLPDPPDPYVKTYLLPDRSKKSKRKSDAKKDTVTPVWNETFEYEIPAMKLASNQLEVSVVDRKGRDNSIVTRDPSTPQKYPCSSS